MEAQSAKNETDRPSANRNDALVLQLVDGRERFVCFCQFYAAAPPLVGIKSWDDVGAEYQSNE